MTLYFGRVICARFSLLSLHHHIRSHDINKDQTHIYNEQSTIVYSYNLLQDTGSIATQVSESCVHSRTLCLLVAPRLLTAHCVLFFAVYVCFSYWLRSALSEINLTV